MTGIVISKYDMEIEKAKFEKGKEYNYSMSGENFIVNGNLFTSIEIEAFFDIKEKAFMTDEEVKKRKAELEKKKSKINSELYKLNDIIDRKRADREAEKYDFLVGKYCYCKTTKISQYICIGKRVKGWNDTHFANDCVVISEEKIERKVIDLYSEIIPTMMGHGMKWIDAAMWIDREMFLKKYDEFTEKIRENIINNGRINAVD